MNPALRRVKDLPSTHLLGAGSGMCAGCGGLLALHEIYDLLGARTVFVNAASCMTLLASYPFTPFRGSWLYTAMASAPAGAQGVRDALDLLIEQGRLPPEEDLTGSTSSTCATTTKATATPGSKARPRRRWAPAPRPAAALTATLPARRICSRSGLRTVPPTPPPWSAPTRSTSRGKSTGRAP